METAVLLTDEEIYKLACKGQLELQSWRQWMSEWTDSEHNRGTDCDEL